MPLRRTLRGSIDSRTGPNAEKTFPSAVWRHGGYERSLLRYCCQELRLHVGTVFRDHVVLFGTWMGKTPLERDGWQWIEHSCVFRQYIRSNASRHLNSKVRCRGSNPLTTLGHRTVPGSEKLHAHLTNPVAR